MLFLAIPLLLFRNVPDARGRYMGQAGYGYVSFERSFSNDFKMIANDMTMIISVATNLLHIWL